MEKRSLILSAAMMLVATSGAYAATEDRTETTLPDNVTFVYWNDVHDDGSYWPNWQFTFGDENAKTLGETAKLDYTLKKGNTVINEGVLNPSWFDDKAVNFYSSEGVLEAGEYTMGCVLQFYNGDQLSNIVAVPTQKFTVPDRSNLPSVTLTYTLTPGSQYAEMAYTIEVKNVDQEVSAARVWADIPGNVTISESEGLEGVLKVDVSDGNVQAWVKGQVTFADGSTMNTTPNDFALVFEREVGADIPVIALTCSNAVPASDTTGSVDYEITGTNLDKIDYVELFVVTTGDKPVSAVLTTSELKGTISLYDLNEKAVTELWVKATAYTANGEKSEMVQYPGEAQGWTGLSVDTNNTAAEVQVLKVENVDVYSIDGRLVGKGLSAAEVNGLPKGLYIAGGKKVLVK